MNDTRCVHGVWRADHCYSCEEHPESRTTEQELLEEVRDESAEDFRTSKYVVVQMTTETWEKLKAYRPADETPATPCPDCAHMERYLRQFDLVPKEAASTSTAAP